MNVSHDFRRLYLAVCSKLNYQLRSENKEDKCCNYFQKKRVGISFKTISIAAALQNRPSAALQFYHSHLFYLIRKQSCISVGVKECPSMEIHRIHKSMCGCVDVCVCISDCKLLVAHITGLSRQ